MSEQDLLLRVPVNDESTTTLNESGIYTPLVKIATPELPLTSVETKRDFQQDATTGLLVPKKEVLTVPTEKPSILRPKEVDIHRLTKKEQEKKGKNAYLFYLSNPWNYFESELSKQQLPSPTPEIQKTVAAARKNIPNESSLILLNSPLKAIRESEKQRLISSGMSETLVSTLVGQGKVLDIQLCNPAELSFSFDAPKTDENTESTKEAFNTFLVDSISNIFDAIESKEDVKRLASLLQKLDVVLQTYQYRLDMYKVDSPELLDTVAQLLDTYRGKKDTIPQNYLSPIFDFISNFNLQSKTANTIFYSFLKKSNSSHPLLHELEYQLLPEDEKKDLSQPKVGLEVEGVPKVLWKNVPEGFEQGLDGGLTLPEYRKSKDHLHFDATLKKQLFDFWYWAKKNQLVGVSVHIHLDIDDTIRSSLMAQYFGTDYDSIRESSFDTLELRFNLSGYDTSNGETQQVSVSSPFFHEQFEFVELITFLESFRTATTTTECTDAFQKLPYFWKTHLKKPAEVKNKQLQTKENERKKLLTLLENHTLVELFLDSSSKHLVTQNSNILEEFLSQQPHFTVTKDDFLTICKTVYFCAYEVQQSIAKYLEQALSFDELLVKVTEYNNEDALILFSYLPEKLTYPQIQEIFDSRIEINSYTYKLILSESSQITANQFEELFDKVAWNKRFIDKDILTVIVDRDSLSIDTIAKWCSKFQWDRYAVRTILEVLAPKVTFEDILILEKAAPKHREILPLLFAESLTEKISFFQFLHLLEKDSYQLDTIDILTEHIKHPLSYKQFQHILNTVRGNSYLSPALPALLSVLDTSEYTLSLLCDLMQVAAREGSGFSQLVKIAKSFPKKITIADIKEYEPKKGWYVRALRPLFQNLDESRHISATHARDVIFGTTDSWVITELLKRLDLSTCSEEDIDFFRDTFKTLVKKKSPQALAYWASLQFILNEEKTSLLQELKN